MTLKEQLLYTVWFICGILVKPLNTVGNWAADKLNKSIYKIPLTK
jgi:hypothetical protein